MVINVNILSNDQLIEYIKENLSVEIESEFIDCWEPTRVHVRLLFNNEVISRDMVRIQEGE